MKGRIIGLIVLALIVAAGLVWQLGFRGKVNPGAAGIPETRK